MWAEGFQKMPHKATTPPLHIVSEQAEPAAKRAKKADVEVESARLADATHAGA